MEKQFQTPTTIYEDDLILVLDKPSGLVVHPFDNSTEKTLVDYLKESHPVIFSTTDTIFTLQNSNVINLGGIVHKLDRDTSGIMINAPLGRNKKEYKQTVNPTNPRGELRSAITGVKVLTRRKEVALLELSPKTGRTHQLRAHMAHIGHPIVGDKAYGSKIDSPRIMLHAKSLSFSLLGQPYTFETETPEEFL
jgi:23S rRNA-/tRNA-specific pseudouridylate synthase